MRLGSFSSLAVVLLVLFPPVLAGAPGRDAKPFTLKEVEGLFPSAGFESQVEFWIKVFAEYRANEIVFHDEDDPRLVYRIERFERGIEGDSAEAKRQREILKRKLRSLQGEFDQIIRLGPDSPELQPVQMQLVELFRSHQYDVTTALLRSKRESIRYQRGVRDKFRESLIRSGMYLPWIEETFSRYGLPAELSVLPHVESSFDYNAYSHAGAAGIWQFTRGTGRSYMQITNIVDERLDPIRATEAAARLLSENFALLGSWPLAITSYNHGRNGMLRARKQHGDDLRVIIRDYRSKYFGFASRNFYTEFLAALYVARNFRDYFGELNLLPPLQFDTVNLEKAFDVSWFTSVDGITDEVLRDLNPHLTRILASRRKIIPAGIEVRVPLGRGSAVETVLAAAKPAGREVIVAADGSARYRVAPGDSIGAISSELQVPAAEILRLNKLRNANLIYPGQLLLIRRDSTMAPASPAVSDMEPLEAGAAPAPEAGSATHTVRAGDTLAAIARRFGTTTAVLQELNGLANPNLIRPGMSVQVPSAAAGSEGAPRRYVVRGGDTLERIALRFGTSVDRIRRENGIDNPNRIRPGQELLIP